MIGKKGGVTKVDEDKGLESIEMVHEAKGEVRSRVEREGEEFGSEVKDPVAESFVLGCNLDDVGVRERERKMRIMKGEGSESRKVGRIGHELAAVEMERVEGGKGD